MMPFRKLTIVFLAISAEFLSISEGFPGVILNYDAGTHLRQESGVPGQAVQGEYRWVGPNGIENYVRYTANENGYVATGNLIPEIPEHVPNSSHLVGSNEQTSESLFPRNNNDTDGVIFDQSNDIEINHDVSSVPTSDDSTNVQENEISNYPSDVNETPEVTRTGYSYPAPTNGLALPTPDHNGNNDISSHEDFQPETANLVFELFDPFDLSDSNVISLDNPSSESTNNVEIEKDITEVSSETPNNMETENNATEAPIVLKEEDPNPLSSDNTSSINPLKEETNGYFYPVPANGLSFPVPHEEQESDLNISDKEDFKPETANLIFDVSNPFDLSDLNEIFVDASPSSESSNNVDIEDITETPIIITDEPINSIPIDSENFSTVNSEDEELNGYSYPIPENGLSLPVPHEERESGFQNVDNSNIAESSGDRADNSSTQGEEQDNKDSRPSSASLIFEPFGPFDLSNFGVVAPVLVKDEELNSNVSAEEESNSSTEGEINSLTETDPKSSSEEESTFSPESEGNDNSDTFSVMDDEMPDFLTEGNTRVNVQEEGSQNGYSYPIPENGLLIPSNNDNQDDLHETNNSNHNATYQDNFSLTDNEVNQNEGHHDLDPAELVFEFFNLLNLLNSGSSANGLSFSVPHEEPESDLNISHKDDFKPETANLIFDVSNPFDLSDLNEIFVDASPSSESAEDMLVTESSDNEQIEDITEPTFISGNEDGTVTEGKEETPGYSYSIPSNGLLLPSSQHKEQSNFIRQDNSNDNEQTEYNTEIPHSQHDTNTGNNLPSTQGFISFDPFIPLDLGDLGVVVPVFNSADKSTEEITTEASTGQRDNENDEHDSERAGDDDEEIVTTTENDYDSMNSEPTTIPSIESNSKVLRESDNDTTSNPASGYSYPAPSNSLSIKQVSALKSESEENEMTTTFGVDTLEETTTVSGYSYPAPSNSLLIKPVSALKSESEETEMTTTFDMHILEETTTVSSISSSRGDESNAAAVHHTDNNNLISENLVTEESLMPEKYNTYYSDPAESQGTFDQEESEHVNEIPQQNDHTTSSNVYQPSHSQIAVITRLLDTWFPTSESSTQQTEDEEGQSLFIRDPVYVSHNQIACTEEHSHHPPQHLHPPNLHNPPYAHTHNPTNSPVQHYSYRPFFKFFPGRPKPGEENKIPSKGLIFSFIH